MTVKVYSSADTGAPVLQGQAGGIIKILDACLVNGYGSFTSAGWTKPYSATTLAGAYRQPSGNGFYVKFDDTCSGTGWLYNGYDAAIQRTRWCGFETMSSITAGTGQFPTTAQSPNLNSDGALGVYLRKSVTADTYARRWFMVATQKMFHLWIDSDSNILPTGYTTAVTSYPSGALYTFGDITSFMGSDAYATILIGDLGPLGYSSQTYMGSNSYAATPFGVGLQAHFMARSYTQTGSSITAGKYVDNSKVGPPQPNPVDGSMWILPLFAYEGSSNGITRGIIPGLWHFGNSVGNYQYGDILQGNGALAGKTFMFIPTNGNRNRLLEISNTW